LGFWVWSNDGIGVFFACFFVSGAFYVAAISLEDGGLVGGRVHGVRVRLDMIRGMMRDDAQDEPLRPVNVLSV
jgi:hypothetical protein